jgi:hypothetical protein
VKTKQYMVDIKASFIKPNDATRMLGDRFRQQRDQGLILNKMNMLELRFDKLKPMQHPAANTTASAINAPSTAPKNDSRDNDQEPSKRALRRTKRTAAQAAAAERMTAANSQSTPPSCIGRNGNGATRTQVLHQMSTNVSQGSTQGSAARQNGQNEREENSEREKREGEF